MQDRSRLEGKEVLGSFTRQMVKNDFELTLSQCLFIRSRLPKGFFLISEANMKKSRELVSKEEIKAISLVRKSSTGKKNYKEDSETDDSLDDLSFEPGERKHRKIKRKTSSSVRKDSVSDNSSVKKVKIKSAKTGNMGVSKPSNRPIITSLKRPLNSSNSSRQEATTLQVGNKPSEGGELKESKELPKESKESKVVAKDEKTKVLNPVPSTHPDNHSTSVHRQKLAIYVKGLLDNLFLLPQIEIIKDCSELSAIPGALTFKSIRKKISEYRYESLDDFQNDIRSIWTNYYIVATTTKNDSLYTVITALNLGFENLLFGKRLKFSESELVGGKPSPQNNSKASISKSQSISNNNSNLKSSTSNMSASVQSQSKTYKPEDKSLSKSPGTTQQKSNVISIRPLTSSKESEKAKSNTTSIQPNTKKVIDDNEEEEEERLHKNTKKGDEIETKKVYGDYNKLRETKDKNKDKDKVKDEREDKQAKNLQKPSLSSSQDVSNLTKDTREIVSKTQLKPPSSIPLKPSEEEINSLRILIEENHTKLTKEQKIEIKRIVSESEGFEKGDNDFEFDPSQLSSKTIRELKAFIKTCLELYSRKGLIQNQNQQLNKLNSKPVISTNPTLDQDPSKKKLEKTQNSNSSTLYRGQSPIPTPTTTFLNKKTNRNEEENDLDKILNESGDGDIITEATQAATTIEKGKPQINNFISVNKFNTISINIQHKKLSGKSKCVKGEKESDKVKNSDKERSKEFKIEKDSSALEKANLDRIERQKQLEKKQEIEREKAKIQRERDLREREELEKAQREKERREREQKERFEQEQERQQKLLKEQLERERQEKEQREKLLNERKNQEESNLSPKKQQEQKKKFCESSDDSIWSSGEDSD